LRTDLCLLSTGVFCLPWLGNRYHQQLRTVWLKACFSHLNRRIWRKSISISTKGELHRVCFNRSSSMVLKHGPWRELWKIRLLHLTTFLPPTYSSNLRIPYTDHVTNADVLLRAGSPPQLLPLIQTRWLRFFAMWQRLATCMTCSEPHIRRSADWPRTGGAAQDVHVTPGYGPWKQTFSRSTTD